MVDLHVVVVAGGTDWHTALSFWVLVCLAGGVFAALSGELRNVDALALDLALAAAGGAALNVLSRPLSTDPLAGIYGVRVFWTVAGALLALSLGHEATRLFRRLGVTLPIGAAGGPLSLLLWLGGWPTEPGLIEATYDGGLPLKLLPDSLHYQTRGGIVPAAQALMVRQLARAGADGESLVLRAPSDPRDAGSPLREIRLAGVRPCGRAAALAEEIQHLRGMAS
ncbi:MAG TPA: hypothetical protein VKV26_15105 [Dehalococcoidia bacterium]|nr:hypothetical protein [Dehalococcoidia bacterium]